MKFFNLYTATERLKNGKALPQPVALFDHLWVEGETCILFATSNVGKSLLAVQIGQAIASGKNIGGFFVSGAPQGVLYYDFELSDRQFFTRYKDFEFSDNLSFALPKHLTDEVKTFQQFEKERLNEIQAAVKDGGFKVVIIDNLTWINGDSEKGNVSAKFMQEIQGFARKNNISVLVIAHTPKRNNIQPLGMNDLFGSSMLSNFVDSMFAIGESTTGHEMRYIKQIKVRNAEKVYHYGKVQTCKIGKNEAGFLGFTKLETESENLHLKLINQEKRTELKEKAKEMNDKGQSLRGIAKTLGVSHTTVKAYLKDGG